MASSAATTATFCATLVDEWLECGVRHAVVSPGSRSTPMALELARRKELELHIFHDERSAAFAAVGIGKASGIPAILLCTSGTAAVEFHAAIVEAHHAEVPVLVCTADRPPELQGVGAPQTIEQKNLYGKVVRKFVDASVADDDQSESWRDLAASLFAQTLGDACGPVHLNLQFREPLVGISTALPPRKSITKTVSKTFTTISARRVRKLKKYLTSQRGLIVAGPENYSATAILDLAKSLGWPIFADPRSCARIVDPVVIAASDSILRDSEFAKLNRPDVVLRIGTPPASKVVNNWLASIDAKKIVVTSTPTLVDPDHQTDLHIVCEIDALCQNLGLISGDFTQSSWLTTWSDAEELAQTSINEALRNEPGLTEPAIARAIYASMPTNSHLVVSSSMPIRDIEWFGAPRNGLTVHANRGVNGIDGVVSTSVGVAIATKQPTALLIGDIALLHDTNGLLNLASRNLDLRIFVIDNNGGGIFSFLPQATSLAALEFEKVFGTPHKVDIEMLARAHQISVQSVKNLEELCEVVTQPGTHLTRLVTDRVENVKVHERINQNVAVALRRL